jgi:SOS response regulatory protein OraA/RecX
LEEAHQSAADCLRAEKIALRLIARAEQSSALLTAKLEKRGVDASIARQVVSSLLDKKLLDDERYAELCIRAHLMKKAQSPLRFLASLEKKGIVRETSRKAIGKVLDEETEYSLLVKFVEQMGDLIEKTSFLRTRLKHEGFSPEIISRFLDSK